MKCSKLNDEFLIMKDIDENYYNNTIIKNFTLLLTIDERRIESNLNSNKRFLESMIKLLKRCNKIILHIYFEKKIPLDELLFYFNNLIENNLIKNDTIIYEVSQEGKIIGLISQYFGEKLNLFNFYIFDINIIYSK
jgi:hypothetical protein